MKLRTGLLILVALFAASPTQSLGQVRQQERRGQLERRVQLRFGEIVREQLDLSPEEQARLGEIVQTFRPQRQDIAQRQLELQRRMALPVTLEDEAAAVDLLTSMIEIRELELQLLGEEQEALLEALTPGQVARFFQLREEVGNQVRRLRGRGVGGMGGVIGLGSGVEGRGDVLFKRRPPGRLLLQRLTERATLSNVPGGSDLPPFFLPTGST